MVRSRLLLAFLAFVVPVTAAAQPPAFIQAVRALAEAARQASPDRGAAIRKAAVSVRAAVEEWDRAIEAQELRTGRELTEAPARAFQLHADLGVAYHERGRFDDAIREFDAALEAGLTNPAPQTAAPSREPGLTKPAPQASPPQGSAQASDVQLLRALAFEADGRTREADQAFGAAWSSDPANPVKAYYLLRRSTNRGGDGSDRARDALSQAYDRLRSAATRPGSPPFVVAD